MTILVLMNVFLLIEDMNTMSMYDLWIYPFGLIYMLCFGYPFACTTTILSGLWLEKRLRQSGHKMCWRLGYHMICIVIYGLTFILFMFKIVISG